jgi:hypothetical protein
MFLFYVNFLNLRGHSVIKAYFSLPLHKKKLTLQLFIGKEHYEEKCYSTPWSSYFGSDWRLGLSLLESTAAEAGQ